MNETKKYYQIYKEIGKLAPEDTLQLILEAESEEEKDFYVMVGEFLLQQRQKKEQSETAVDGEAAYAPVCKAAPDHVQEVLANAEGATYSGAMDIEYGQFAKQYNYISNLRKRFAHPFGLIVISLDLTEAALPQIDELEKSMFFMEQAIQHTLRNVDVMTRYGKNQFFIILLGTDPEGAEKAVDRIFKGYYEMNSSSVYTPSYFIAEMEEKAEKQS